MLLGKLVEGARLLAMGREAHVFRDIAFEPRCVLWCIALNTGKPVSKDVYPPLRGLSALGIQLPLLRAHAQH